MVHRRELDGREILLGNQGDLFGNAMTWWDHETGSVWSQPLGEAILGPLKGARLELLPSELTTWESWRARRPATLALDVPGWRTGFDLDEMAVVVSRGTGAVAYRIPALRETGVVNDTVAGVPIVVVGQPDAWAVFSRRLDDRVAELELTADGLRDRADSTLFDAGTGTGLRGPARHQSLDRIPGFTAFPEDFFTFFPDGRIWPP